MSPRGEEGGKQTTTATGSPFEGAKPWYDSPPWNRRGFDSVDAFRKFADSVIAIGMTEDEVVRVLGEPDVRVELPERKQWVLLLYGSFYEIWLMDRKVAGTKVNFGF